MKAMYILPGIVLLSAQLVWADSENKSHSEGVDRHGTSVTIDSKSSVSKNLLGTKEVVEDSKVVRDPKGLGNKTTETAYVKERVETDGDRTRVTESVDAAGTARKTTHSAETSGNWLDSGSTTKIERSDTVDPRGLGNKHVEKTEEQIERDGEGKIVKRTVTKEVDGDTVEEKTVEAR